MSKLSALSSAPKRTGQPKNGSYAARFAGDRCWKQASRISLRMPVIQRPKLSQSATLASFTGRMCSPFVMPEHQAKQIGRALGRVMVVQSVYNSVVAEY